MGEIKHSFTAGKMNKDLDERLVPNGQYRNAMNIQVRTTAGDSDGVGDAGVIQNLQGNKLVGTATGDVLNTNFDDTDFTCVGSIADEKIDAAYFLFTSGELDFAGNLGTTTEITKIDTIIEYNTLSGLNTPVVVDRWGLLTPILNVWNPDGVDIDGDGVLDPVVAVPTGTITEFTVNTTFPAKIRENMNIIFYQSDNTFNLVTAKVKKIDGNTIILYDQIDATSWDTFTHASFIHDRVLNFVDTNNITGINIIDRLLLWTDGTHEPKKINIPRCKAGTNTNGTTHTQLMVSDKDSELQLAGELEFETPNPANNELPNSDLLEEHITVIKKAPKTPPTIEINSRDLSELKFTTPDRNFTYGGDSIPIGGQLLIGLTFPEGEPQTSPYLEETNFIEGDIINVIQEDETEGEEKIVFQVMFISYVTETATLWEQVSYPTNQIQIEIIQEMPTIGIDDLGWSFNVALEKPKFELKFARFGYRYKFEDGEYSSFSPWSEIAFDPGRFDYDAKKGYNLGMVNTIQSLTIKDFIPYYTDRALDIVGVDILYKSTDSPNVYTIKSIQKEKDPEWELFSPNTNSYNLEIENIETGKLEITSEAIHRVLPSNQALRTFDNVPRYAKAQEITGSRVVYGNYTQGFDINFPVSLKQHISSQLVGAQPKRSVKTIRNYKIGMVFGDEYGRETPVVASGNVFEELDGVYSARTGDIVVEKDKCAFANNFVVKQEWSNPLSSGNPSTMKWMDYVKYYVKETSNEYYNLVLDRWYYARNNQNIWLSFPSADRNKVDKETHLLLKKSHGNDIAVLEAARYKIIDIDNEAPDFIKIDHRTMGLVKLDNASVFTNPSQNMNTNEPNLLVCPNCKRITIPQANWDNFLSQYKYMKRGKLKVRIVGKTVVIASGSVVNEIRSGNYVTVNNVVDTDAVGTPTVDQVANYIQESFGIEGNMLDRFNTAGYTVGGIANDLQYYLEFKEEVVENKPEFDGRFFVLIEKDIAIEKNVEKFTGAKTGFTQLTKFKIGYIDTQQYSPAETGPYSTGGSGAVYGDGVGVTGTGDSDFSDYDDPGAPWEWWGWGTFPTSQEVNFFALGCQTGRSVNSINYGRETKDYWIKHREHHNNNTAYNVGYANRSRVFLDGARANMMMLKEFDEDGINEIGVGSTTSEGDLGITASIANDQDNVGGMAAAGDDAGASVYNYKPTALDQGAAAEGFGRMMFSQQSGVWNNGQDGWDENPDLGPGYGDTGDPLSGGAYGSWEIQAWMTTEGTYFQFAADNTNCDEDGLNCGPHTYVTIHREEIGGSMVQLPVEYTYRVYNYGAGGDVGMGIQDSVVNFLTEYGGQVDITTDLPYDTMDIDAGQSFCNAAYGGPNANILGGTPSGKFGGENEGMWGVDAIGGIVITNSGTGVDETLGDGTAAYPGSGITMTPDGWGSINVGVSSANNCAWGGYGNSKEQRRCLTCDNPGTGSGYYNLDKPCARYGFRFEFRRINPDTGEITNSGLIPGEFDPRGFAKHDGTIGNILINIMQKVFDSGSIIVPESDRSVWETEPKEGKELDVYYEATHAIPIQLKKGNTLAFAPLKSKVNAIKNTGDSASLVNLQSYSFNGNIFTDARVGGVEYTAEESIIKVINTDSNGDPQNATHKLGIGDYITFTHSSGLRTRSEIEDYYKLDDNSTTYVPVTRISDDREIEFAYSLNIPGTAGGVTINNSDELEVGMNVIGVGDDVNNVPSGIFIIGPFTTSIPPTTVLNDTTWMTVGTVYNVEFVAPTGFYQINKEVYQYEVDLGWHNCYSFGNGVESDRIRDDFNAPQIDNGIKVSTTFVDYGQEDKTSGLTYSGLYNAISSVNDLNEFNMGEKISKNINPAYGSIQALKTRDTDLVTFCEDKVLKILANKEAVFSADNDPRLIATDRVLGQVTSFKGEYGISKNPESLSTDQYRMYFTDKQRGAVLRLSMDGLTPISNVGMKSWFRENLKGTNKLLGTFDKVNGEYNLTIDPPPSVEGVESPTVSFNEGSKGWVSFKSFSPDKGTSVSGTYLTVKNSGIFKHYVDITNDDGDINNRNLFYGLEEITWGSHSTLTVMFNDSPGIVKSFKTVNYEGSQARIDQDVLSFINSDSDYQNEYYNIFENKPGWWVSNFETDLQDGKVYWFVDKENKWFNKICGVATTLENLDTKEFTVQGIGSPTTVEFPADVGLTTVTPLFTFTIQNNTSND